jgi:hypothetical protein
LGREMRSAGWRHKESRHDGRHNAGAANSAIEEHAGREYSATGRGSGDPRKVPAAGRVDLDGRARCVESNGVYPEFSRLLKRFHMVRAPESAATLMRRIVHRILRSVDEVTKREAVGRGGLSCRRRRGCP